MKKFKLLLMSLICGIAVFQLIPIPKVSACPLPPVPAIQLITFLSDFRDLVSQSKPCDALTLYEKVKEETGIDFWALKMNRLGYGDKQKTFYDTVKKLLKIDHIGTCESFALCTKEILDRTEIPNWELVMPGEHGGAGHISNIYLDPLTDMILIADATMQLSINALDPENENDRQKIISANSTWFGDQQPMLEGAEYAEIPMGRYLEFIEKHFNLKKENMMVHGIIDGRYKDLPVEEFMDYMRQEYGPDVIS